MGKLKKNLFERVADACGGVWECVDAGGTHEAEGLEGDGHSSEEGVSHVVVESVHVQAVVLVGDYIVEEGLTLPPPVVVHLPPLCTLI